MTSKQRVEAAFRGAPVDRIPVNHRGFSGPSSEVILGRRAYTGGAIQRWNEAVALWEGRHEEFIEQAYSDAVEIAFATGQDLVRAKYWGEGTKPTERLDENSFLFAYGEEVDWRVMKYFPDIEEVSVMPYREFNVGIEYVRVKTAQLEKFAADYKPVEQSFYEPLRFLREYGDTYAVEVGGASIGIGQDYMPAWLEAMITDPPLVKAMLDAQAQIGLKNISFVTERGLKYITGGTDFCSEQGPMYSPAMFAEFVLPGLKKMCGHCRKNNAHYLFASDGNLWPVADYVFGQSGVDGFFEIDRKAGMDLARLRQEFPHLTCIGNLSSWTLALGSGQDVRDEVVSCCQAGKKYNGVIVGVSNAVQPETPKENIICMLEALEENRNI